MHVRIMFDGVNCFVVRIPCSHRVYIEPRGLLCPLRIHTVEHFSPSNQAGAAPAAPLRELAGHPRILPHTRLQPWPALVQCVSRPHKACTQGCDSTGNTRCTIGKDRDCPATAAPRPRGHGGRSSTTVTACTCRDTPVV